MPYITVKDGTQIYYKDWGQGPIVTFSHGWPLNAWQPQPASQQSQAYKAAARNGPSFKRANGIGQWEENPLPDLYTFCLSKCGF